MNAPDWRSLWRSPSADPSTQNSQNTQKGGGGGNFEDIENFEYRDLPVEPAPAAPRRWWRLTFADGSGWPTYRGPVALDDLRIEAGRLFRRTLAYAVALEETPDLRRAREAADGSLPADDLDGSNPEVEAALAIARQVADGTVPGHWTAITTCRRCGPVPIWPGAPAALLNCPWCRRRVAGLPVPRPVAALAGDGAGEGTGPVADGAEAAPLALVICDGCRHFEPNHRTPSQGIGRCLIGGQGSIQPVDRGRWHGPLQPPLWPLAERECRDHRPGPGGTP